MRARSLGSRKSARFDSGVQIRSTSFVRTDSSGALHLLKKRFQMQAGQNTTGIRISRAVCKGGLFLFASTRRNLAGDC